MQRGTPFIMKAMWMFQSSSSQKAGCNRRVDGQDVGVGIVSILIQPEGRMQPGL